MYLHTQNDLKLTRRFFVVVVVISGLAIDAIRNPNRNDDNASKAVDGRQQFKRLDRNRGIYSKPFKFPTIDEHSRRVHFPSERHSVHGIDAEPAATTLHRDRSFVVFPRSDTTPNELPMPENADTVKPIAVQSNGINEPLLPNSVNISAFVENQMAIDDNGLEPFVYINDDGLFEVKYVPRGENGSQSNDNRPHSSAPSAPASINKTEETAIISNDNRQIPRDHRISTEANNERSATATIDLIHSVSPINNTKMIFQWTEAHTKEAIEQQKQQQASPSSTPLFASSTDKNEPRLFNDRPIFA